MCVCVCVFIGLSSDVHTHVKSRVGWKSLGRRDPDAGSGALESSLFVSLH